VLTDDCRGPSLSRASQSWCVVSGNARGKPPKPVETPTHRTRHTQTVRRVQAPSFRSHMCRLGLSECMIQARETVLSSISPGRLCFSSPPAAYAASCRALCCFFFLARQSGGPFRARPRGDSRLDREYRTGCVLKLSATSNRSKVGRRERTTPIALETRWAYSSSFFQRPHRRRRTLQRTAQRSLTGM
jgi:hypothetical protein